MPRPIIVRDKHEVTWSNLAQNAGTTQEVTLVSVVKSADADAGNEISVGSKVRGIYIEFNCSAETITSTKTFHWQVCRKPSGITLGAANTYYQDARSYILKRGMEMLPKSVNTIVKRIIYVPMHGRLKNLETVVFRYVASSTEAINICGFGIFQEKK